MRSLHLNPHTLLVFLSISSISLASNSRFDSAQCCITARALNAFQNPPSSDLVCGQSYTSSFTPPAPPLFILYSWCAKYCGKLGVLRFNKSGQWAASLVQFLLPALIFVVSIPRSHAFVPTRRLKVRWLQWSGGASWIKTPWNWMVSLLVALGIWLVVLIDLIVWVTVTFALAGPMMTAGLYEALLDYKIMSYLRAEKRHWVPNLPQEDVVKHIVAAVLGNLYSGNERIVQALLNGSGEDTKQRLRSLMDAQPSFGATVGIPIVFFLGTFVYTVLDLLSNPSNQDTSDALAYGVMWMVIPHVAIVSGCLLASNNPSTVTVLVGALPSTGPQTRFGGLLKPIYNTPLQPTNMWERGWNKAKWVRQAGHIRINKLDWVFISIATAILIALPPVAASVVAWRTPPIGWGCRSLNLITYAVSEITVTILFVLRHFDSTSFGTLTLVLYLFFCILAVFTSIGGSLMVTFGVYGNCICSVAANEWLNLSNAVVNVASDTEELRKSSSNWLIMGSVATMFMAVCAFIGWRYQNAIRERYEEVVNGIADNTAPFPRPSSAQTI